MNEVRVQEGGSIFVYSEELGTFDFGYDHPFKPERSIKTYELCNRYGVINLPWMTRITPEPIDPDLLNLFHDPEYISLLQEASLGNVSLAGLERGLGTDDNPVVRGIYEWTLLICGGTYSAIKRIVSGKALVGFNPLGGFHHAMPGNAEGFCYINDIVIGIKDVLDTASDLKIAYIDIDAHHGNGVQHAFYDDPRVLFISLHESGETLYPWSGFETEVGEGNGKGYNINLPLQPGTDDEVYGYVFKNAVLPVLNRFTPDLIVAELGADALISDPLTHLKLTNNGYQDAINGIMSACPRILALGGGGYDIYRTARCWTLAWSLLNHVEPMDEFAGLVGGMMFGPEKEVGSLYDHPYYTTGEEKEKAFKDAHRIVDFIRENIFPTHGL